MTSTAAVKLYWINFLNRGKRLQSSYKQLIKITKCLQYGYNLEQLLKISFKDVIIN